MKRANKIVEKQTSEQQNPTQQMQDHQEQQDIYVFDVNGKEIAIPDDFIQGNHHQNENTQQDEITVIAEIKVKLAPIFKKNKSAQQKPKIRPSWSSDQWKMAMNKKRKLPVAPYANDPEPGELEDVSNALTQWIPPNHASLEKKVTSASDYVPTNHNEDSASVMDVSEIKNV